jgi:hypothetical protein
LVNKLLTEGIPEDLESQLIIFLAHLRTCCFDGEFNRTYGTSSAPLTPADLANLKLAYGTLAKQLIA